MNVLVFPRDDNPYQAELYGAIEASHPVVVRYLEGPTPSQSLNLLLLPLLLAAARVRGFRVLHVHWVYPFQVTWARGPAARGLVEWWYSQFLRLAVALGFRIVWTAHNLLPHEPVFRDDLGARRTLVDRCDAVIAHAEAAASIVRNWGAGRVVVIPQGVDTVLDPAAPTRSAACAALGLDPGATRVLFFGRVLEYKGVDVLLEATARLPRELPLEVSILGECRDPAARAHLEALASSPGAARRVRLRLAFVTEAELSEHLAVADFAVFPFRTVTNSSSVVRALAAGVPVVIPALAGLDDVPLDAAIRYVPGDDGAALIEALTAAATVGRADREVMADRAAAFAAERSWPDAAAATWALYDELLVERRRPAGRPAVTGVGGGAR